MLREILMIESEVIYRIVQILVLVVGGMFIMRIAGRKSISQMTFPTLVVTLAYGTVLIEPMVMKENELLTLLVVFIMVVTLFAIEWLQIKINWLETLMVGHAVTLVKNGELQQKNLTKSRISIDQLESYLREMGIKHFSECEWVTLEPHGKIGYLMKKENQTLTNKEFMEHMNQINSRLTQVENTTNKDSFNEVSKGKHDNPIDTKLE